MPPPQLLRGLAPACPPEASRAGGPSLSRRHQPLLPLGVSYPTALRPHCCLGGAEWRVLACPGPSRPVRPAAQSWARAARDTDLSLLLQSVRGLLWGAAAGVPRSGLPSPAAPGALLSGSPLGPPPGVSLGLLPSPRLGVRRPGHREGRGRLPVDLPSGGRACVVSESCQVQGVESGPAEGSGPPRCPREQGPAIGRPGLQLRGPGGGAQTGRQRVRDTPK